MLDANARLSPNRVDVAARILDGEAILINLSSGMYYSLDLAGGLVWQMIEDQRTLTEIAAALAGRYVVAQDAAEADVRRLAEELLNLNLVQLAVPSAPAGETAAAPAAPPDTRAPYQPPVLHAYHDMAELLALDPPHPLLSDRLSNYPSNS